MNDSAVGLILLIARRFALALVGPSMCATAAMSASAFAATASPPASAAVVGWPAAGQDASTVESSMGLDCVTRPLLQREVFDAGVVDGLFGPWTRAAIRRWQDARGLPATGYLDGGQVDLLRVALVPPVTLAPLLAGVDSVGPLPTLVEASAVPLRTSGGVPPVVEVGASAPELPRVVGAPTSPPFSTDARAALSPPILGGVPNCDAWNTQVFFEIDALLAAGPDIEARDDDGWTPLHQAAVDSESPAVIEASRTLDAPRDEPHRAVPACTVQLRR